MTRVRVETFTISIDGYGAGPEQDVDNPLGVGAEHMHEWLVASRAWRELHGKEGGTTGIDNDFASRGVGSAQSISIFARASSMSCTWRSRRFCSAGENDYLTGWTCALSATTAWSSRRRRRQRM